MKLSSSLADEEFVQTSSTSCDDYSVQCSVSGEHKKFGKAQKLKEIMKPLNFFTSKMRKTSTKGEYQVICIYLIS